MDSLKTVRVQSDRELGLISVGCLEIKIQMISIIQSMYRGFLLILSDVSQMGYSGIELGVGL